MEELEEVFKKSRNRKSPGIDGVCVELLKYGDKRKMAVFWIVALCSLVEVYQCIALMMEAARTSETLVNFYQTTQCYNPEDSHLQYRH
jgi:hypothetical protein